MIPEKWHSMVQYTQARGSFVLFALWLILILGTIGLLAMSVICLLGYLGAFSSWKISADRSLALATLWAVYGFGIYLCILAPIWRKLCRIPRP